MLSARSTMKREAHIMEETLGEKVKFGNNDAINLSSSFISCSLERNQISRAVNGYPCTRLTDRWYLNRK